MAGPFIEEWRPTVEQVNRVADALNELLRPFAQDDGREALLKLVEQLQRKLPKADSPARSLSY